MLNLPVASEEMAQKFATEKETPYERWVQAEGLDIIPAHYVPNLRTVDLKPWPSRGGKGVFINLEASRHSNDCYVAEIGPGGKLVSVSGTLFRCREIGNGWYEGALYFNREQFLFASE